MPRLDRDPDVSTNYYWRHNICACCGRHDEWHICKNLTSFEAHFGPAEWDDTIKRFTAPPPLVTTWAEWKGLLRTEGQVWDEYGHRHDVEAFIARVENTKPEDRRRQYDWCATHPQLGVRHLDCVQVDGDWLDPDGFSFYGGDFS